MILKDTYTLNNGVSIPKLGLGTWFINNKQVADVVIEATKIGYRHIDTAQAYRNEKGIGEGLKRSNVHRRDLFITTKLAAEHKSYKKAKKAIDKSLKDLQVDYLDLMIIHSPQPWTKFGDNNNRYFEGNLEAWKALEEAYDEGKIKAIGVSNFQKEDLDNLLENATIKPMVNQILAHISNTPVDLIQYCKEKNILVEAYSPVAHGELLKNEKVKAMAGKYNVSIPQLSIQYCLQLGLLPLPKSTNPKHLKSNTELSFEITQEDMHELIHIEKIKDYGEASMMPVYGGKLNFKTIVKMILQSFKGNS